jgi:uncharacterized protein YggE
VRGRWLIFVLLMSLASAAFAQQPPPIDQNLRIIQMDGHGESRANPDQASMSFAIETKGSTAQEAAAENAQIAQKVTAALKAKVGAGGKVETGGYSLSPLFANTSRPQAGRISDWTATNEITVECDPSVVGDILDAAQVAGAEGTSDTDENSGKTTIQMNVEASALTAREANKKSSDKAREVVDKIKAKLDGKGTIKVTQGRVQAENLPINNQMEIFGYQASNSVSVKTPAIDQVGSLIDTAIATGATRADSVTFNLRDDSKARGEAIADACKDAQIKANAAAQALGLKVKRVMRITSTGDFRPQQRGGFYAAAVQGNGGVTTPINPGEITVPATVTVTYELE